MSPDEPGKGATRPNPESGLESRPEKPGTTTEPPPQSGGDGEAAGADQAASHRSRIEETLRRRSPRGVEESDSVHDRKRTSGLHPPPEASASEHWSWTIRRRVAEGSPAPESGAEPAAEDETGAGELPPVSQATEIRERVERRLQEVEDRRSRNGASVGTASPSTPASPRRGLAAAPGSEEPSRGPEGAPDWDTPWVEDEEGPKPRAKILPARPPSRLAAFIATCGFVGRIPIAPGTFGAAVGLVAFALTRNLAGGVSVTLLAIAIVAGVWAGGRHAKDLRQPDPPSVVVDEFCGMWLALVGTNPSFLVAAIAFAAFRFLDIVKPPPVRQAERLAGGVGIMADDLVAGGIVRVALLLALGV